jgi:hypothetical protein
MQESLVTFLLQDFFIQLSNYFVNYLFKMLLLKTSIINFQRNTFLVKNKHFLLPPINKLEKMVFLKICIFFCVRTNYLDFQQKMSFDNSAKIKR